MTGSDASGRGYWEKVGVQLPTELAEEWRALAASGGRGRGRLEAAGAVTLWLALDEATREAVLERLTADLALERPLSAAARRAAARAATGKRG